MKFAWYIVDCEEGGVEGTNDVEKAQPFVENDRYVVLSGQHGVYFQGSRSEKHVQEMDDGLDEDPEDEGEDEPDQEMLDANDRQGDEK